MTKLVCLTIWQPWASLIAIGAKPYEFRSWSAPGKLHGQRIGIHASARPPKKAEIADLIARLRSDKPWSTALHKDIALPFLERVHTSPGILPLSHLLGTAVLGRPRPGWEVVPGFGGIINDSNRAEHCNYAWPLTDWRDFEPPIEAKGQQGFWHFEAADHLADA